MPEKLEQNSANANTLKWDEDQLTGIWTHKQPGRICKKAFSGSKETPQTKDFINRTHSIFTALYYLAEQQKNSEGQSIEKLKYFEQQVINNINSKWNIDAEFERIHDSIAKSNLKNKAEREKELRYKYLEKAFAQYLSYMRSDVLPKLLAYIEAPTSAQALAQLVEADTVCNSLRIERNENNSLTKNEWPEIDCEFKVSTPADASISSHFSIQTPKGRVTYAQLNRMLDDPKQFQLLKNCAQPGKKRQLNFSCYMRFGEGLPVLREVTSGYLSDENKRVVTLKQYRHASPVPYQEKDPVRRMAMTMRNAEQIVEVLADDFIAKKLRAFGGTEKDYSKRIELNENIASYYANPSTPLVVPLTEIRLLSPTHKKLALLDKHQQYQQILESFIAFSTYDNSTFEATVCFPDGVERNIYVKPSINFFDFGVNYFRHEIFSDPLQDWINTRGFNELCDNVVTKIEDDANFYFNFKSVFDSLYENKYFIELKEEVNQGRLLLKDLLTEFRELIEEYENCLGEAKPGLKIKYQHKISSILVQIENQHVYEAKLLAMRKQWWAANRDIITAELDITQKRRISYPPVFVDLLQGFAEAQDLYYSKQYNSKENNYCLQKTLVRLNYAIGRVPATGCNDDKDRGSRLVDSVEADELFYQRRGYYPHFANAEHRAELKSIQATVHQSSSSLIATELYSAPGARGKQLYADDGNEHLDLENSFMAHLGKEIFHLPLRLRIKNSIKDIFTNIKNKFIGNKVVKVAVQPEQKQVIATIKHKQESKKRVLPGFAKYFIQTFKPQRLIKYFNKLFEPKTVGKIILSFCLTLNVPSGLALNSHSATNSTAMIKRMLEESKDGKDKSSNSDKDPKPDSSRPSGDNNLGILDRQPEEKNRKKKVTAKVPANKTAINDESSKTKKSLKLYQGYSNRKSKREISNVSNNLPDANSLDPGLSSQVTKKLRITN